MSLPFVKNHGLGNDFVVLDMRGRADHLTQGQIKRIANRRLGVGCDQLILLEPAQSGGDVFMRIFNPDGSQSEACGNATRCVAERVLKETEKSGVIIETLGGHLACTQKGARVSVDMGRPRLGWDEIPMSQETDTLAFTVPGFEHLGEAAAVNMGNPHCVFFVSDVEGPDIPALGPALETHPLFPERANIGFAQIITRDHMRLRVWERGAGLTLACGSGACAATIAAIRRGLTDRTVRLDLDGGQIEIAWREDDHVIMTGPVAKSFTGILDDSLLAEAP